MRIWKYRNSRLAAALAGVVLLCVALPACSPGGEGDAGSSGPPPTADEPSSTAEPTEPAPNESAAEPRPAATARLDGIDVSMFQGEIDWQAVKASGVVFAYARALEGVTIHDSRFAANWRGMEAAGVTRGAYAFYVADDPAQAQAEFFASLVALEPGDLVPMVDIEQGSIGSAAPADLVTRFHTYLELVESHYGVKPIIYTDPNFWNEHMDGSFGDYPLWVADYGVASPTLPVGWSDWVIWQHSESGSVPGIDGAVDLDLFRGGLDELDQYRVP